METKQDEAALARCYDEMYQYMINKNTKALGNLLADNFVLIHMTGLRQPKNEYLKSIADGTLNYYSCTDTDLSITIHSEKAKMIGKSKVAAAVYGGGRITWRLQLNIDLEKINDKWLITLIRASTY
ncbi:nuclear transport factor 2 family protein [Histomonas meleagridis]|uniref:nuclear transport factor 2 family protein n=1 Tax=Histomonas meleagridis TaxID=135588 RepID=UPI00355A5CB3|nr:nuclear transport factor 2 family protein [Histomonas meleagridis]KAH0803132.1 nuclear transport factor 2 family protein [Histomonas meleagridis]